MLKTPYSYEANSNNAYRNLRIPEAIEFAKRWSLDEPFASRPLNGLCYYYSLEGAYSEALTHVKKAISIDRGNNFTLRLNFLFARIQSGDVDGADMEILRLSKHQEAKKHTVHLFANLGALAYIAGDLDRGRDSYRRAIRVARATSSSREEALASAFFARAARQHGDPMAEAIINEITKSIEKLPSPGAIYVMRTLVSSDKRISLDATAAARVAKRQWIWDAMTNTLSSLE